MCWEGGLGGGVDSWGLKRVGRYQGTTWVRHFAVGSEEKLCKRGKVPFPMVRDNPVTRSEERTPRCDLQQYMVVRGGKNSPIHRLKGKA